MNHTTHDLCGPALHWALARAIRYEWTPWQRPLAWDTVLMLGLARSGFFIGSRQHPDAVAEQRWSAVCTYVGYQGAVKRAEGSGSSTFIAIARSVATCFFGSSVDIPDSVTDVIVW